jgi:hypothetical protein
MALVSLLFVGGLGSYLPVKADTQVTLKKFNSEALGEQGCPVEITGAQTELEIDPFGMPVAARHYIDYRNAGNRQVAAVKFRIGYVHPDGRARLPYQSGDDDHLLQPGEQASRKFRGSADPETAGVKIRVLKVKFADGSVWESAKANPPAAATAQDPAQGFAPLTVEQPGMPMGAPDGGSPYGRAPSRAAMPPSAPLSSPIPPTAAAAQPPADNGAADLGSRDSLGAQQGVPGLDGMSGVGAAPAPAAGSPGAIPPAGQSGAPVAGTNSAAIPVAAPIGSSVPPPAPPRDVLQDAGMPPRVPSVHLSAPADPMAALDKMLGTQPKQAPPNAVNGATGGGAPGPAGTGAPSAAGGGIMPPQLLPPLPVPTK